MLLAMERRPRAAPGWSPGAHLLFATRHSGKQTWGELTFVVDESPPAIRGLILLRSCEGRITWQVDEGTPESHADGPGSLRYSPTALPHLLGPCGRLDGGPVPALDELSVSVVSGSVLGTVVDN